jgi:putative endonuclease
LKCWGFMFTVYVLYSISYDKIYIGFTSDIEQRLISHNHPKNKSWTGKFKPWVLIYSENFEFKSQAMKREKQLKSSQGRQFIWSKVKEYVDELY